MDPHEGFEECRTTIRFHQWQTPYVRSVYYEAKVRRRRNPHGSPCRGSDSKKHQISTTESDPTPIKGDVSSSGPSDTSVKDVISTECHDPATIADISIIDWKKIVLLFLWLSSGLILAYIFPHVRDFVVDSSLWISINEAMSPSLIRIMAIALAIALGLVFVLATALAYALHPKKTIAVAKCLFRALICLMALLSPGLIIASQLNGFSQLIPGVLQIIGFIPYACYACLYSSGWLVLIIVLYFIGGGSSPLSVNYLICPNKTDEMNYYDLACIVGLLVGYMFVMVYDFIRYEGDLLGRLRRHGVAGGRS